MIGRNDSCWCGSGKKWKKCHSPDPGTEEQTDKKLEHILKRHQVILKTPEQIAGIRRACLLATDILEKTCAQAKEGVTTEELNAFAHQLHKDAGAIPAPLHYGHPPYPKSICTSRNEEVCHGIPDDIPLREGDIMNIDVSCILNGYYGDCSKMVIIGNASKEALNVVEVAYECLMQAIAALAPGKLISVIGDAIETRANRGGCSVVSDFVGHGIGLDFHEGPQVFHYRKPSDLILVPNMTFTIEPMINAGRRETVLDASNHWTARTIDGKMSAQWEHTLLMTESGCEILTPWKR